MTPTPRFYQQIQHQQVRDLAWTCLSPSLMRELPGSDAYIWPTVPGEASCAGLAQINLPASHEPAEALAWLRRLDQDPQPLLRDLASSKSTRLGIYFENLLRFYWRYGPHNATTQLLAHNLQVQMPDSGKVKGSTHGAFDFLLRTQKQFWHVESTIKFYLGLPDTNSAASQWQQWVGPNCNDRLDIKLEHLRLHQLALSRSVHAQEILTKVAGGEKIWRRGLCIKGYFFYPAGRANEQTTIAAPLGSNPRHLRGDWWYLRDFLMENPSSYWMVLSRDRWLSAAQTPDIHALYSGDNLRETLQHWVAERHKPQLLAAMQKEGDLWLETSRSFVVPDHWPWADLPSRNT